MTAIPTCECLGMGIPFFWVSASSTAIECESNHPFKLFPLETFEEAHSIASKLRTSYPSAVWEVGCTDYDPARLSRPGFAVLRRRVLAQAIRLLLGQEHGLAQPIDTLCLHIQEAQ